MLRLSHFHLMWWDKMTLVSLFILACAWGSCSGIYDGYVPEYKDYYAPGDIDIGVLLPLYYSSPGDPCSRFQPWLVQVAQTMLFMKDKINADQSILPGTSLGLAFLADCLKSSIALARATQFLPVSSCVEATCTAHVQNSSRPTYPVVAVVGCLSSSQSSRTASLFDSFEIPSMSFTATSNELSNKEDYKYFSRLIPPDRYQIKAMVDLIAHYNWTYISAINVQGSFGTEGIQELTRLAKVKGICIAYSKEIKSEVYESEYDKIVEELLEKRESRVLVTLIYSYHMAGLALALERASALDQFIRIAGDSFKASVYSGKEHLFLGTFATVPKISTVEEFKVFYETQSPWRDAEASPWFGQYTPQDVGCEWESKGRSPDKVPCQNYKKYTDFPDFYWSNYIGVSAEVVQAYAIALHNLISAECPKYFGKREELASCVTGPLLLAYLRNVSYDGYIQKVKFDENGDIYGGYDITYLQRSGAGYRNERIGEWSRLADGVLLRDADLEWYLQNITLDDYDVPESVCAKPCGLGEHYIQGELVCCWQCRKCRENEKVQEDLQGCEECPNLMWPVQPNVTSCEAILPTYMHWEDPLAIGLEALAGVGLASVLVSFYVFMRHSKRKVIKGSSIELMMPIVLGMLTAYLSVFGYITKPRNWSCYAAYFGFHISCTLIFAPLFLKTIRMYRIFAAAEKCQQIIRGVDSYSQLFFLLLCIIIQVGLSVGSYLVNSPGEKQAMPVSTEKLVELLCDMSLLNLILPLSFNLLLLLLCAIFGFLTRKLPDNFNESWFIFISVSTTIFIWIAFLPTHMMAFYAYHKAALLSLAMILNSTVTTLCLFAPKMYAVYFVDEKTIKVTNFSSASFSGTEVTSVRNSE